MVFFQLSTGAGQAKILLPSKQQSLRIMEAERQTKTPAPIDPEQDKKERNCAASARFRKKKREQYLVCSLKGISRYFSLFLSLSGEHETNQLCPVHFFFKLASTYSRPLISICFVFCVCTQAMEHKAQEMEDRYNVALQRLEELKAEKAYLETLVAKMEVCPIK